MKCPNCGADNPDAKKYCGDCGVLLSMQTHIHHWNQDAQKRVLKIIGAVSIVLVVVLAVILALVLAKTPTPERVLSIWLDRMNNGDAAGAVDLSIYAKMDLSHYESEIQYIKAVLDDLGTYKLSVNYANEIPKGHVSDEPWYTSMLLAIQWLKSDFGTVVTDYRGMSCSITAYDHGVPEVWVDTWPVFEIDSSWYLAYRFV